MMATTRNSAFESVQYIELSLASRWVAKGKIACRSLAPETIRALSRLEKLRLLFLSIHKKLRLSPVVRDWDLKNLREFCDGILDSGCPRHEWRSSLLAQHASRRTRVQVAATLFLFRKVVPKPLSRRDRLCWEQQYIDKMTTPQSPLDPDFRSFCRTLVHKMFRYGWDSRWQEFVNNFTLPTSSCLERKRSEGGPRGLDRLALRMEYLSFAAEGKDVHLGLETTPMVVWTGGKWRLVTKFGARRSFLSPLHRLIYSHLSKENWLLRGEATHDRFSRFGRKEGEVFVSGDYESATDNLNIELSELLLDSMRQTSSTIPHAVWAEARRCLRNRFPDGRVQSRGQLMGSLLSFPLLCLSNYVTFRYAIPRRSVPVKINGDDIVFRCRPDEKDRWFELVGASGLTVSSGKTLVCKTAFSLNSTFFFARSKGSVECPVVRPLCLFGGVEDPCQIGGRLQGVYRGGGIAGDQVRSLALREMSKQIWSSQRSLRRGLGCTLSWRSIRWSGLLDRENFYNKLPSEAELPPRRRAWAQNAVPENYVRIRVHDFSRVDEPEFYREMVENCWTRSPKVGEEGSLAEYWAMVKDRTFSYVPPMACRFATMAGMSVGEYDALLLRQVNTERPKGKLVWAASGSTDGLTFRSGGLLEDQ